MSFFLYRGRYAEKVLPLLVFAQEKLLERAEQHGGISTTQPDVVLSADSGKPEGLKINLNAGNASFEPGVHIDPKGHDVYSDDNNAQRLFCVPVDKASTLQLLKQSVELKHCAARALQHSRELFLRYLAGLGKYCILIHAQNVPSCPCLSFVDGVKRAQDATQVQALVTQAVFIQCLV